MPVKSEYLKDYIKTHLITRFIQLCKAFADTFIFFDNNSYSSLCLYIDYQDLNNLSIKNWYLLSLIGKTLNQLG